MRLHCCPPFRISKYEWGRELDLQRRVSVMLDYVYIIIFIQKWLIWGGMKQNNDPKLTFLRRTIPWSFGKIIIDICWCGATQVTVWQTCFVGPRLLFKHASILHQRYSDCLILAYVTHLRKRSSCLRCLQNVQCT